MGPDVLGVEAGDDPADVVAGEGVVGGDLSGEEAAGQRAEGHEPDPQLGTGRQDIGLEHPLHDGVLTLDRGEWCDGMGPADLVRGGLRHAPGADLPVLDELTHDSGDVFDRGGVWDAVEVVELDLVGAEAGQ